MSLLEHLGWGPFFQEQIAADASAFQFARVIEEHRGQYQIAGDFEGRAELSGRFRHDAKFGGDFPVVGDWVGISVESSSGPAIVRRRLQRRGVAVPQADARAGRQQPLGDSDCGAVVGVAAPSKNMSKPAGQWNRMIITCEGNRMQVELNGEEVVDLDLSESDSTRSVRSGRIGFENKNSPVAFRNVKIKSLDEK